MQTKQLDAAFGALSLKLHNLDNKQFLSSLSASLMQVNVIGGAYDETVPKMPPPARESFGPLKKCCCASGCTLSWWCIAAHNARCLQHCGGRLASTHRQQAPRTAPPGLHPHPP